MRYRQARRNSPRNTSLILDWVHIITGALVVIMAVAAFVDPEDNMILFPVIFFLASALNMVNGVYRYQQSGRDKRKKASAMGLIVIAVFLLVVMVVSAFSIWRRG
ncbi:MAG: hypothetical protein HFG72_12860 [Hungatella sp.]|jgi:uncharacterized membrane protein|nr:hypothetical protein [Hungatella sp.]